MPHKLVTIYRCNQAEADLWKAKLESEGIKAVVIHDITSGGAPYAELKVRERDVRKASRIVKPIRKTWSPLKRSEKIFFNRWVRVYYTRDNYPRPRF